MIRFDLYLEKEQLEALKKVAARTEVSVAELIRRSIADTLDVISPQRGKEKGDTR